MLFEMFSIMNLRKNLFLARYRQEAGITTHLTDDEKFELYRLAGKHADMAAVEIGSYLGASSCLIAAGIRKSRRKSKLFCIDTWHNDSMTEGARETFKEFKQNTQQYRDIIVPLRGLSTEVIPNAGEHFQKIDFLFIDGDHSYEACKKDWDLCSPLLREGSVVVFHDTGWAEGVQRVVREDVVPRVSKEGRLPNLYWAKLK